MQNWAEVDAFIESHLSLNERMHVEAQERCDSYGLPKMEVTPSQGKFLYLLAKASNAKQILEIGTLGGYSTLWLVKALQSGGLLTTLELDEKHVSVARENFIRAGYHDRINLVHGNALDILGSMVSDTKFDFVFIDADKASSLDYLKHALRLCRSGAFICVDNVVRNGALVDASKQGPAVNGIRSLFDWMKQEPRLDCTAIQTVGKKGWDGFLLAQVL